MFQNSFCGLVYFIDNFPSFISTLEVRGVQQIFFRILPEFWYVSLVFFKKDFMGIIPEIKNRSFILVHFIGYLPSLVSEWSPGCQPGNLFIHYLLSGSCILERLRSMPLPEL